MKKLIFFLVIFSLFNSLCFTSSFYQQQILDLNPFGYYRLNETSGSIATNLGTLGSSANGTYHGVTLGVNGALAEVDPAGRFSKSNSSYVNTNGLSGVLNDGEAFSVEAWFKTSYTPGSNYKNIIFGAHTSSGGNVFRVGTGMNGGIFLSTSSGDYVYGSGFNNNVWHHLVVTLPGNAVGTKVYVDGAKIASVNFGTASWNSATKFSIAQDYDGSNLTDFFDGDLDEVALYNSILSKDNVELHNLVGTTNIPETSSLILLALSMSFIIIALKK